MAIRHNIHTNPALSVDNSPATWFGPSGWARSAALHASLPRQTGWTGTAPGDLALGRAVATAGKYYTVTASARFIAPTNGYFAVDWYAAGNVYLIQSAYVEYSQAANSTNRFGVVILAPDNAVRIQPVAISIDGEAQWTAVMVREFDTYAEAAAALAIDILPANYFDGDTPGATWDGTTGKSASSYATAEPAAGVSTLSPPMGSGLGVRTSRGTGVATLLPPFAATGLFATATYDDRRGRIRLDVQGLASQVIRVIVYSRAKGTSRWRVVRGGRVAVSGGTTVRRIDDYEWQAGRGVEYRIDALSSPENTQPESVVQSAYCELADTLDQAWLKFIPAPHTNLKVELLADLHTLSQGARTTLHRVAGRADPIAVTDVHDSIETSVRFVTRTDADRLALKKALTQGAPAFLQVPESVPIPSMYVAIGNIKAERVGKKRTGRTYLWTVDITEIAPPPPSIVGSGMTWGTLLEQYETWGDVLEAFATWGEVIG